MEEYLQHMKTLRSQMNDVEDQVAKISVEEQKQITTIQTLTKEIDLAKSETRKLKEDADIMLKAKGSLCVEILQGQRKIAVLENDSSTLSQTLELIQQERVSLSSKLFEKRTIYSKTEEEMNNKLKEQQEWLRHSAEVGQHSLVNGKIDHRANELAAMTKEASKMCDMEEESKNALGQCDTNSRVMSGNLDDIDKNTMRKLDAAKAEFDLLIQMRSELASESQKVKQSFEKLKCRMNDFKPELRDMLSETLEEELQALLSDKSGETEYLQSMQNQIETIKGISYMVKCGCGEEYRVKVDLHA